MVQVAGHVRMKLICGLLMFCWGLAEVEQGMHRRVPGWSDGVPAVLAAFPDRPEVAIGVRDHVGQVRDHVCIASSARGTATCLCAAAAADATA